MTGTCNHSVKGSPCLPTLTEHEKSSMYKQTQDADTHTLFVFLSSSMNDKKFHTTLLAVVHLGSFIQLHIPFSRQNLYLP